MNCTHPKDDLILHFYDELEPLRRAQVEARLESCEECRAEMASLEAMGARIPREPLMDVSEADLERIRKTSDSRIALSPRHSGPSRHGLSAVYRVPASRWAVAAVIAAVAFGLGRTTSESGVDGSSFDSARVSNVKFDSQTGLVNVSYETVRPGTTSGTIHDAGIQQLLGQALHSDSPPLSRMRAARALAESRIRPSEDVVSALEGVLVSEPNAATRLQALKAVQQMHEHTPLSGSLRSILLDLVVNEPNTAIRMRALDAVTRSERVSMELAYVLEVASKDQNPHIRRQASMALVDMETSRALEELN